MQEPRGDRSNARVAGVARGAVLGALVIALGAGPVDAKNNGIDSSLMTGGIPSCNLGQCHFFPLNAADPDLTVTITGPSDLLVNESADYSIAISGTFGPGIKGAGVFVAAYYDDVLTDLGDGILGETSTKTQITTTPTFGASGQFTHADANGKSIGIYSYSFSVLAPSTSGELRLEGAMNGFNGDSLSIWDEWQKTSKIITVPEPASPLTLVLGTLALARLAHRRARLRN